jgi:hypothetical protein
MDSMPASSIENETPDALLAELKAATMRISLSI